MHWRAADKPRVYQFARTVEPYLGDMPYGLEPVWMSVARAREESGWVVWLKHTFLAYLAVMLLGLMVVFTVAILVLFAAQPSLAQEKAAFGFEVRVTGLADGQKSRAIYGATLF
jgi:hypothetical protein